MRKNVLVIMTIAALALPAAFSARPSARAEEPPSYTPGWRVQIISVPYEFNITDFPPPEAATFVAAKPEYSLADYMSLAKNTPKFDYVLWKGEAFLKAEEAGHYVFSIVSSDDNREKKAIYVEDNLVATGSDSALMGAAELEPGLYKVGFRVAGQPSDYNKFKILVKRPSGNRGLPISQVLLTPAGKKK